MSDKINASIMLLRSRAMETLGLIKQINQRPSEEPGDAEKIADLALQFVQQEGAMISLQQMLRPPAQNAQQAPMPLPATQANLPKPSPVTKAKSPKGSKSKNTITEEDLKIRSPTFRKSQSVKRVTKKKEDKDES